MYSQGHRTRNTILGRCVQLRVKCTVNAHIITNLDLAVQRNNSSVTDFLLCYYTNAQSFMNKHDEFMNTEIDVINPHIIGITESWCHNRKCAKGGGDLLYVSNNLEYNYCSTLNIHKFNDSIWCIMNLHKNMKLLVGVCYQSPSSSEENNRELAELISKALSESHITHIPIFGDFNYINIDWEHMNADLDKESELFYNINENLLVQHINVNTLHKLGNSPSRLDLIFTNEEDMMEDIKCLAPLGKSDHLGLSFKLVTSAIMKIN